MKEIWVVHSNIGIITDYGWFESEEDCLKKCAQLKNGYFGDMEYSALKINKNASYE